MAKKSKKTMHLRQIFVDIYGEMVEVLVSDDPEMMIERIDEVMPKDYRDNWKDTIRDTLSEPLGACFVSTEENYHWICLQRHTLKKKDPMNLSIIAHECLHITNKILERRGLSLTGQTEEAFCYLQQFIFRNILEIDLSKKQQHPTNEQIKAAADTLRRNKAEIK